MHDIYVIELKIFVKRLRFNRERCRFLAMGDLMSKDKNMAIEPMSETQNETLGDLLCFSVYSTSHAFNHLYRRLLSDLGLTYPQYLVMTLLWQRDNLRVNAIGQELALESNTLTPLLKRLETLGFVARKRDTKDERVVLVELTSQGNNLREKAREIPNCVAEAVGLDQDDFIKLTQMLRSVRNRLTKDRT